MAFPTSQSRPETLAQALAQIKDEAGRVKVFAQQIKARSLAGAVPAHVFLLLCAAAALLLCGVAMAAPFAIGGVPSAAADKCVVTGATHAALNGEFDVVVDAVNGNPANGNRVCRIDVAAVPEGNNTLSIALKSSLWGVLGAPVNFSFVRPTLGSLVVDSIQLKP